MRNPKGSPKDNQQNEMTDTFRDAIKGSIELVNQKAEEVAEGIKENVGGVIADILPHLSKKTSEIDSQDNSSDNSSDSSEDKEVQTKEDGEGTLFERRYWVDIEDSPFTAVDLMAYIKGNINQFTASYLADFEKSKGLDDNLKEGDEFSIKILGPWDGEVRVTDVDECSFEFITLEGHPEAGTIRFRASDGIDNTKSQIHFEIRSLAKSRDGLVAFLSEGLGVGLLVQERMWLTFCKNVADFAHGRIMQEPQSSTVSREETWWQSRTNGNNE